jgi:hypothetical protein
VPALRRLRASVGAVPLAGKRGPMRLMFVLYAVLITVGLTFFTVVGLTHH